MDTKRSTVDEEWANTSIRLPREHLRALRVIAAKQDRTVSAEVRRLIEQHIAEVGDGEVVAA